MIIYTSATTPATDVTTYFKLVDPSTGVPETGLTITDLDATYVRDRAAAVKADLTALAAVDSAHGDNQAKEVDGTNAPGLYRVDWPDAAFATGVSRVQLVVNGAAIDPAVIEVELMTPLAEVAVKEVTDGVTLADGAHGGSSAVLTLQKAIITATGNDNAVTVTGKGTGAGISVTGGDASGAGLSLVGGVVAAGAPQYTPSGVGLSIKSGGASVDDSLAGNAILVQTGTISGGGIGADSAVIIASDGGGGITIISSDVGIAIESTAHNGVQIVGGSELTDAEAGTSVGVGLRITAPAEALRIVAEAPENQEAYGIFVAANGEAGGAGVKIQGHAASGLVPALLLTETDGDGPVVQITPRDGVGIQIDPGNAGNSPGVKITGMGTGSAIELHGGGTGAGITVAGGGTSGDGVNISATNGDGMQIVGAGAGNYDINADIQGSLSGSVGSVTGAVGSVTGAVGSVTGAVGSVTGSVGSVASGGITATSIATNAIDADALAADAVAEIADGVWDEVIPGAHVTTNTAGLKLLQGVQAVSVRDGTMQAGSAAGTAILDTGASALNDYYNHNLLVITGGTGAGQVRSIQDYTGASKSCDVVPDWVTTPDVTSTFSLLAMGELHAYEVHQGVTLADDAITSAKFDESTAFPLKSADTGATQIARVGADADTLETLSDQIDLAATAVSVSALNDLSAAEVNAEVVDALNVDTYAEPGQGAPAATASLAAKIGYLFKAFRNKKTQTSTTLSIYNDAGDTVDQKATVSDDATTFTKGEIGTGP